MSSAPFRFPRVALTLALAACAALVHPAAALAGEQAARLTLTVELERQGGYRLGTETGRMTLTQRVEYAVTLVTDGAPAPNNPLDPDDGARQLARARQVQQRMQAAQATAARTAGRASPPVMDAQAMQAMAQRVQAACGTDRACLMREASRFHTMHVAAPGGGTAAAADDPADETPYLIYYARSDCRPAGSLRMQSRIEGSYPDVQGPVPFTETQRVDDGQAVAALPCGTQMAVLDTRSGRLWVDRQALTLQGQGVVERQAKGRPPQRSEGAVPLRWHEAQDWLVERFTRLDRKGLAEATLPADGGQTKVRLQWGWQAL